jgi:hypothetical protein
MTPRRFGGARNASLTLHVQGHQPQKAIIMDDTSGRPPFDAPEENNEQQEGDQAQDVAAEALDGDDEFGDTERGGSSDPAELVPQDVPDLVEKMNEMVTSGLIDNDAFFGEPVHDDEEGVLGDTDQDD